MYIVQTGTPPRMTPRASQKLAQEQEEAKEQAIVSLPAGSWFMCTATYANQRGAGVRAGAWSRRIARLGKAAEGVTAYVVKDDSTNLYGVCVYRAKELALGPERAVPDPGSPRKKATVIK